MKIRLATAVAACGALTALAACADGPTDVLDNQSAPLLAKGGNKPDKGGGGGPSANMIQLGEFLFQDANLSLNGNQACQTCHHPDMGFAAALPGVTTQGSVVQGSIEGNFGNRKPPSAAYATVIPNFTFSGNNANGGNFWDGRATGEVLGSAAADQALGPFLNPKEQALPSAACVVYRMWSSDGDYFNLFEEVWGALGVTLSTDVDLCTEAGLATLSDAELDALDAAYGNIARSIAAYETTFNVFDSDYDRGNLTAQEAEGAKLFGGKGKCQQCHDNKGNHPTFSEFEFHNLGVPANPANPEYDFAAGEFDPGLGGFTGRSAHLGKFKTPTVRNVAEVVEGGVRTYMHNGALISLKQVVDFYNTRDMLPTCDDPDVLADPFQWGPDGAGCWPPPEYSDNLDTKNMGNLGLTNDEVLAIVAFMEALTDLSEPNVP